MAPPGSGGDFNVPWEPIPVLFTNAAFANTRLTTLAQVNAAVSSGQAIEVPVPSATFHCQVVPATVYVLAPRSEFHLDDRKGPYEHKITRPL